MIYKVAVTFIIDRDSKHTSEFTQLFNEFCEARGIKVLGLTRYIPSMPEETIEWGHNRFYKTVAEGITRALKEAELKSGFEEDEK